MKAIALLLLITLTACATGTYRQGFDVERFRSLEPGKTTKADVLALAGPPIARVPTADGEVWTYYRTEAKATAVILPFYGHVESTGGQTKIATLTFRGEVLEKVEYRL